MQRVQDNLVLNDSIRSRAFFVGFFTILASHTTTGVSDADFVAYVAAVPTTSNFVWLGNSV